MPIGWIAAGDPAELFSPDRHDELWAVQAPLDFPGTVYGLSRDATARERMSRQSAWFGAHRDDHVLWSRLAGAAGTRENGATDEGAGYAVRWMRRRAGRTPRLPRLRNSGARRRRLPVHRAGPPARAVGADRPGVVRAPLRLHRPDGPPRRVQGGARRAARAPCAHPRRRLHPPPSRARGARRLAISDGPGIDATPEPALAPVLDAYRRARPRKAFTRAGEPVAGLLTTDLLRAATNRRGGLRGYLRRDLAGALERRGLLTADRRLTDAGRQADHELERWIELGRGRFAHRAARDETWARDYVAGAGAALLLISTANPAIARLSAATAAALSADQAYAFAVGPQGADGAGVLDFSALAGGALTGLDGAFAVLDASFAGFDGRRRGRRRLRMSALGGHRLDVHVGERGGLVGGAQAVGGVARDDPAAADQRDLLAELLGLLEVVRGEQDRRARSRAGGGCSATAPAAARSRRRRSARRG